MILVETLDDLVEDVRTLMVAGDWLVAIERIREKAARLGIESDQLVRQVAARAIELGHVEPLRMEPGE